MLCQTLSKGSGRLGSALCRVIFLNLSQLFQRLDSIHYMHSNYEQETTSSAGCQW